SKPSSSGYSKPSLDQKAPSSSVPQPTAPSSSGYSKPTMGAGAGMPGSSKPSVNQDSTRSGSSGYSKPSIGGTAPSSAPAAQAPPPAAQTSSGYAKPSLGKETAPAASSTPTGGSATTSSGYAKPTLGGTSPQTQPSSGGYSKPPAAGQPATGYAKPSASPAASPQFSGGSKFDKEAVKAEQKKRSQESLGRYKSEQEKFKNPGATAADQHKNSPLYDKGKVYSGFDYNNHYQQRDGFYRGQGYAPPPYMYNSRPSFGMFDALFLYWMLDNVSNRNTAATAYHHQNDPGYQQWRREMDNTAKDNPDVKNKLAELDRQVKAMEGTPRDPSYLPKGVPANVALAPSVLASKNPEKPLLRVATGRPGGWYNRFGDMFKGHASDIDVQLVGTTGSLENLELLLNDKADMAIIQSDLLAFIEKKYPNKKLVSEQSVLYLEYAQLITHRDSGVKSVRDINPKKHTVLVGPKGSGTALTWEGLCIQDAKYKKIPIRNAEYFDALSEVERNPNAIAFFVGGLRSEFLQKAEEAAKASGNLRLAALDDPRFKNTRDVHGNQVYQFAEIPKNVYPSLQKGWLFTHAVETLAVQAVLVVRSQWTEKFGNEAMEALSRSVLETKPDLEKRMADAG
ncbi:MAG: TAXI family TRAP transporter solute-binding subunit, partial [Pseudomonadota bacterium]